jgi:hypothetical protein
VKPFSNHLASRCGKLSLVPEEAVVLIFLVTGLAFAVLCVLGTLSSSVREPSI